MTAISDVAGSLTSSKPLINLLRGWPNPALLPAQIIDKAAHSVLNNKAIAVPALQYGPDSGDLRLRKSVANWLTRFYKPKDPATGEGCAANHERITITGGASQNLACMLQVFTDPVYTRNIWMVSPSYMLAFRIFDDSGFEGKLRAVPEDDEGIDIAFLRRGLQKSEEQAKKDGNDAPRLKQSRPWTKVYKHIIYAVPTFSNPSMKTMSLRRREELVRVAREYDALVITDDVYDFLQWPSKPDASGTRLETRLEEALLPRIVDVDRYLDRGPERNGADGFGNAVSNGSFSKICGPGLRTGWVEGTEKLAYAVSQTGSSASGGSPSQLCSAFLAEMMGSGDVEEWIYGHIQPSYGKRYSILLSAIEKHLVPLGVQLPKLNREVAGGYFIWLTLPEPVKGAVVAECAKESENLIVAEGGMFEVPGDNEHAHFENALRLCYAYEGEEQLTEGIERLANAIRSLQDEGQHCNQAEQPYTEQSLW
ncbi:PLP-dependent transferase [Sporormia fimetaria CBS 119925]|uniref:PLP-dependent transferase n=1 Tax=Sporormia fimetaria CBS 119925 TaxID=1340428 RepID=A0A6A6VIZ6_9PLEO|nr:PLP-dependent transferase [Sporormia fimetaria CBS 119925]